MCIIEFFGTPVCIFRYFRHRSQDTPFFQSTADPYVMSRKLDYIHRQTKSSLLALKLSQLGRLSCCSLHPSPTSLLHAHPSSSNRYASRSKMPRDISSPLKRPSGVLFQNLYIACESATGQRPRILQDPSAAPSDHLRFDTSRILGHP